MTAQEMWEKFCETSGVKHNRYDAWCYGVQSDELAELTKQGIKTATASAYIFYELENEPLPKAGDYSVVLNQKGEAVCIIQISKVAVLPFSRVSVEHAYKEGEGDRTLAYWRKVHKEFFRQELAAIQQEFNEGLLVVCEEFTVVFS